MQTTQFSWVLFNHAFCLFTYFSFKHINLSFSYSFYNWKEGFLWMMISLGYVLPDSDASRVMYYINSVTSFTFHFYFTQIMKRNQTNEQKKLPQPSKCW